MVAEPYAPANSVQAAPMVHWTQRPGILQYRRAAAGGFCDLGNNGPWWARGGSSTTRPGGGGGRRSVAAPRPVEENDWAIHPPKEEAAMKHGRRPVAAVGQSSDCNLHPKYDQGESRLVGLLDPQGTAICRLPSHAVSTSPLSWELRAPRPACAPRPRRFRHEGLAWP